MASRIECQPQRGVFATDRLNSLTALSPELERIASGVLWVALSRDRRDVVLWFRPSADLVVNWAGEPTKVEHTVDGIPRLSPRGSFALWKETVRGRSESWQPWEVSAAANLRVLVLDSVQRRAGDLLAQNDRLLAADRSKDMFLAAVSHELRTPLQAILGWVSRIQGGELDSERMQRALDIIQRNARIQAQLVDDLLDVARMVGGKLAIQPAPLDLTQVVTSAIDTVLLQIESSEVRLAVEVDESCTRVEGDSERLQQVVWNLLTNAIKFTPRGGTVRVQLKGHAECVELAVTDSGRGLSADSIPRLFEAFWQVDGAPSSKRSGLGLGLSITKHIVELHGGSISASSPGLGLGATFCLRLPRADLPAS